MPKYGVYVNWRTHEFFAVEAEDEKGALKKALEMSGRSTFDELWSNVSRDTKHDICDLPNDFKENDEDDGENYRIVEEESE